MKINYGNASFLIVILVPTIEDIQLDFHEKLFKETPTSK